MIFNWPEKRGYIDEKKSTHQINQFLQSFNLMKYREEIKFQLENVIDQLQNPITI